MRFLFLTQYYAPEVGAAPTRLVSVVRELVRLGHEVEVVTAMPNHPTGRIFSAYRGRLFLTERWEGVPVHRVWLYASMGAGTRRLLNYLSFSAMSLLGLVRARRPDYLFVESPPLFLGLAGILGSRIWRVPMIFNVSDLWPDAVRELGLLRDGLAFRFAERLERWIYRRAAAINAVTEGVAAALVGAKGVPAIQVLPLRNGVDTELFRPRPEDAELREELGLKGKTIVLYTGTHGYAHALEYALETARLLEDEVDIHFLFMGDGSEKPRLVARAEELGLRNVTFLDPVPLQQLPRYLSIAKCGLVTLRDVPLLEGAIPAKTLPLMAAGRAVVFMGRGEGARLVEDAGAGLVVPPADAPALAGAIRDLIRDPARAERFGRAGQRYAEERLGWSALVRDWLGQLDALEVRRGRRFQSRRNRSPAAGL